MGALRAAWQHGRRAEFLHEADPIAIGRSRAIGPGQPPARSPIFRPAVPVDRVPRPDHATPPAHGLGEHSEEH